MAKRKSDEDQPSEAADLMAVVEATDPATAPEAEAPKMAATVADAPPAPIAASPERRGGTGPFFGMVLGGVLAAGAGFGLARAVPDLLPSAGDSGVSEAVAAQAEELAALREQLAALPEKPSADERMEERIAALEQSVAPDLTGILSRIDGLEEQVAALASRPVAEGAVLPDEVNAELAKLREQVNRLGSGGTVPADVTAAAEAAEARLKEAEARAAALAQEAEAAAATSRRAAALDRIAVALDTGGPFTAAVREIGDGNLPPGLAEFAASGVPTVAELEESFPDVARASLEAALRANMGESWTERVSNFLRSQTGLRSLSPREGNDPDAVLSRAEAALMAGDVAAAVNELAAMPEAGKPALEDWLATANQRVEAEAAFAALVQN